MEIISRISNTSKVARIFEDGDNAIVILENQAYEVKCLPEDVEHRTALSMQETGVDHSEWMAEIEERLGKCDAWAWCGVSVRAIGSERVEFLGCCSYENAADFILNSGYFMDMVAEVTA